MTDKKTMASIKVMRAHGVITTLLLVIWLVILLGLYVYRTGRTTRQQCYNDLTEATESAREHIENDLRSDRVGLRILASVAAGQDDLKSMDLSRYLDFYDENILFSSIAILTPDNEIIRLNGSTESSEGICDFETEAAKGEHVSGLQKSFDGNIMIMCSYTPIERDGEIIGLLMAEMGPSNMARVWHPDVYGGSVSFLLVDREDGEILVNGLSKKVTDISKLGGEELAGDILKGKSGFTSQKSVLSSAQVYVSYTPMEMEDWEIIIVADEADVFSSTKDFRRAMDLFLIGECVVFAVYLGLMFHRARKSILETERMANTDILTGLQNRNRFEERCRSLSKENDMDCVCIYMDVNGLHELNNTEGHDAGDRMLQFVADKLIAQFGRDNTYRIGGDEFVVIETVLSASIILEKLETIIRQIDEAGYHVSTGVCGDGQVDIDEKIRRAEKRMYDAKNEYYKSRGRAPR